MHTMHGERKYMENASDVLVEFDEIRCPECATGTAHEEAVALPDKAVEAIEAVGGIVTPPPDILICEDCGHVSDRWHRVVPPGGIVEIPEAMVDELQEMGFTLRKSADVIEAMGMATVVTEEAPE